MQNNMQNMQNNMQKNSALFRFCIFCILQYAQYAKYAKQYAEKYVQLFGLSRGFNVISTESQAVPKRRLTSQCPPFQTHALTHVLLQPDTYTK